MRIIGAFDVHRKQITFKWLDTGTGEVRRGRIMPALRETVQEFLAPFKDLDAHFALEATTGWRFVAEELSRAKVTAHLAEPAETATLRGPKRRAKTDRREWQQRLQAQLFHQGVPHIPITTAQGRTQLAEAELSAAGRQVVMTGLEVIDHLDRQLAPLDAYLVRFSKLQPGCRALQQRLFGVGDLTAVFIWAELGNCVRFSSSDDAVRYSGLDITVYESADKRPPVPGCDRQGLMCP